MSVTLVCFSYVCLFFLRLLYSFRHQGADAATRASLRLPLDDPQPADLHSYHLKDHNHRTPNVETDHLTSG